MQGKKTSVALDYFHNNNMAGNGEGERKGGGPTSHFPPFILLAPTFAFIRLQSLTQRCVMFSYLLRFPTPWESHFPTPLFYSIRTKNDPNCVLDASVFPRSSPVFFVCAMIF